MGRVYKITCPEGRSYVGQVHGKALWKVQKRLHTHGGTSHCREIKQAVKKHGICAFRSEILAECADGALDKRERDLIEEHGTQWPAGYNAVVRGGGAPEMDYGDWARQLRDMEDREAAYKKARIAWHNAMWHAREAEKQPWGAGALAEAQSEWEQLWRDAGLYATWKQRCAVNGKGCRSAEDLAREVCAMGDREAAFVKMRKQWYNVVGRARKQGNEEQTKEDWTRHWAAAGLPLDRLPGQGYAKGWEVRRTRFSAV